MPKINYIHKFLTVFRASKPNLNFYFSFTFVYAHFTGENACSVVIFIFEVDKWAFYRDIGSSQKSTATFIADLEFRTW